MVALNKSARNSKHSDLLSAAEAVNTALAIRSSWSPDEQRIRREEALRLQRQIFGQEIRLQS